MNKFDRLIDRRNTASTKWEKYVNPHGDNFDHKGNYNHNSSDSRYQDIIPMWVADTDFKTCPAITNALQKRVEQGVFGYTLQPMPALSEAIVSHLQRCHDWSIETGWIVLLPSLVTGFNLACQVVRDAKDKEHNSDIPEVIIPSVIYPPFKTAPTNAKLKAVTVPLVLEGERWVIDLDTLQGTITDHTRMIIVCNPQNPGGSVYTQQELTRIHQFCEQHDLLICSDEIHCDLVLDEDKQHLPIAKLNEDAASRTITLMAASKTFNVAGLGCGFAIIANAELREKFRAASQGLVPEVNVLAQVASTAAFNDGHSWMREQNQYLQANRDFLTAAINAITGLKMVSPEATFLAWIDIADLKLEDPAAFFEQAGVGMSEGSYFGDARFMRLNFGCSREVLETAVQRIKMAVDNHMEED